MIELAPDHKMGLVLRSPVMIAAGFCGYGDAYAGLIEPVRFGAVVTQPVTLRPQPGRPQPRLIETGGGFILNTGLQNPGVKNVIRHFGRRWARLETSVIAHLPAAEPNDLMRAARALNSATEMAAFELGIPLEARPEDVIDWVQAIQDGSELPILAKVPLPVPLELAEAAATAYVDALVVGAPPAGSVHLAQTGTFVDGALHGPFLAPLAISNVRLVAENFDLPLVAVGGIHTLADVRACLAAGASAVQLDSLLFVDPRQAAEIAGEFLGPE